MRLIDADALMKEFAEYVRDSNISDFARCPTWNDAVSLLGSAPTIEERKTGRWIDCTSSDHWKCSECGDRAPIYWDANRQEYDEWFSPYCPSCGADMRGEEHEL